MCVASAALGAHYVLREMRGVAGVGCEDWHCVLVLWAAAKRWRCLANPSGAALHTTNVSVERWFEINHGFAKALHPPICWYWLYIQVPTLPHISFQNKLTQEQTNDIALVGQPIVLFWSSIREGTSAWVLKRFTRLLSLLPQTLSKRATATEIFTMAQRQWVIPAVAPNHPPFIPAVLLASVSEAMGF
ncbi:hypothetical protein GQ54DRAFT_339585 [Martensiomyces pterosporus]|nr:hypothetical protein GQ54DRAFT_339585 [Martensiomyces pterosporus]